MRRIIILSFIKLIRAPGIRGPVCPRVPRSIWILEPPVFVEIFYVAEIYFLTLSLRRTFAPPRKLFWFLGFWVVVCVKAGYFPGAGGVGSLRLRPLFVLSIVVPQRTATQPRSNAVHDPKNPNRATIPKTNTAPRPGSVECGSNAVHGPSQIRTAPSYSWKIAFKLLPLIFSSTLL